MERNIVGALAGSRTYWIEASDRLRVKAFCSVSNFEYKMVVRFMRATDAPTGKVCTVTKILYPNNQRGTGTPPASGSGSFPFGAAAGVTRTVTDAGISNGGTTLTSATAAFVAGDVGKQITISNAGSAGSAGPNTPTALYHGQITSLTNGTTVEVNPPAQNTVSNATLIIEPVLLDDTDGLELGNGWLLGVDFNFWRSQPKRGQVFLEAEINRGAWNIHQGMTLIKQYLEPSGHLSWPYGNIASGKADGKGWIQMFLVANPSAGADWTATVPTNARWRINSFRAQLTASASAANRVFSILADDGGSNLQWSLLSATAQTASQTVVYEGWPGCAPRNITPAAGTTLYQVFDMPNNLELSEGCRLRAVTAALNGSDQWSAIVIGVEEWIEE